VKHLLQALVLADLRTGDITRVPKTGPRPERPSAGLVNGRRRKRT
jgi:hypothetical protein